MLSVRPRFVPAESVVCAELDGESVLLDIESGVYFGLDTIGTDIWKMIENGYTISEMVSQVQETYDITSETVRTDLEAFVAQLHSSALVRLDSTESI